MVCRMSSPRKTMARCSGSRPCSGLAIEEKGRSDLTARRRGVYSMVDTWGSADRSGPLEILITPSNGPSSSRMRKTAAATDIAATPSTATTVAFRGA